ncbi:hypothetical protein KEJ39_05345 [Candidatus Bathyarchaeota archaeon]|nr:hypothetical protein [Candidatus Bathyarchaeota archaeon]
MVILYAHTDYAVGAKDGKILSTAPPYGQRRSAILDKEIRFILYPPLSQELHIQGSVNYKLHLRSPVKRSVQLNISLYEVEAEGSIRRVSTVSVALPVEDQINPYVLGIPLIHTFSEGSTVVFSIIPRSDVQPLVIFWDDPQSDTYVALPIKEAFKVLELRALDLVGEPLAGAHISVVAGESRIWDGRTDPTGWVKALVPRVEEIYYEVTVRWMNIVVNRTLYRTVGDAKTQLRCRVYRLELLALDLARMPVGGVQVAILRNDTLISEGKTSGDGRIQFNQLPESEYTIGVRYDFTILMLPLTASQNITLHLLSNTDRKIDLPVLKPWVVDSAILGSFALMATVSVATMLRRRKKAMYEYDFEYIDEITGGGIPASSSVMISGQPGSGKTVLATQLLLKSLRSGNRCIFITNVDFPSNIRREISNFEPKIEEYERNSRLIFIDCYSALSGQQSCEEHRIPAVGDLTGLGVQISECLEKLGQNTDVFFDSLTPLFTILRDEYICSFVHSVGAKTKGVKGRFIYTLGSGVNKKGLQAIESISDCIIETSMTEVSGEYRTMLRIKKMMKKHLEGWTEFRVQDGKGVTFRTARPREKRGHPTPPKGS